MSWRDYNSKINCDRCDVLLGMWAYGGPFHGSMRCVECANTPDDDDDDDESEQANSHGAGVK